MRKYAVLYVRTDNYGIDTSKLQTGLLMEYIKLQGFERLDLKIEAYRDKHGIRDQLSYLDEALQFCLQAHQPDKGIECHFLYVDLGTVLRSAPFTRRLKEFKTAGGKIQKVDPGRIVDEYAVIKTNHAKRMHDRHTPLPEKVANEQWRLDNNIDKRHWQNFLHIRQGNIDCHLNGALGEPPFWVLKKIKRSEFRNLSLDETAKYLNGLGKKTVTGKGWTKENVRRAWDVVKSSEYLAFTTGKSLKDD